MSSVGLTTVRQCKTMLTTDAFDQDSQVIRRFRNQQGPGGIARMSGASPRLSTPQERGGQPAAASRGRAGQQTNGKVRKGRIGN